MVASNRNLLTGSRKVTVLETSAQSSQETAEAEGPQQAPRGPGSSDRGKLANRQVWQRVSVYRNKDMARAGEALFPLGPKLSGRI